MPYRKTPLVPGEVYHVFNRSVARQPIFLNKNDYQRALESINYYRYQKLPLRFSHFKRLSLELRKQFTEKYMTNNKTILEILAYCVMPNHIHFLLRASEQGGIQDFMRNLQNSYSKYFNVKRKRSGALFQAMFKAVRIESDEQLIHVSRYIHLNPVTSFLTDKESLSSYVWSSFNDYISDQQGPLFVSSKLVSDQFKSRKSYREFVLDQADYQRSLAVIKHLVLE